ncbi:MAG: hypothetical protein HOV81_14280 [Kofleriaceae bacterium]|nr:hypothetical protein [Kofleriaceae bacterium]
MAGALASVKKEWELFKHDPPGVRFCRHRARMQNRSRTHTAIALSVGILLVTGGIVLLFMPGPGVLAIFFGLGLIAAQWERLASFLDRVEVRARRLGRHAKARWLAMSGASKIGLLLGTGAVIGAVMMVMWKFVVATYAAKLLG